MQTSKEPSLSKLIEIAAVAIRVGQPRQMFAATRPAVPAQPAVASLKSTGAPTNAAAAANSSATDSTATTAKSNTVISGTASKSAAQGSTAKSSAVSSPAIPAWLTASTSGATDSTLKAGTQDGVAKLSTMTLNGINFGHPSQRTGTATGGQTSSSAFNWTKLATSAVSGSGLSGAFSSSSSLFSALSGTGIASLGLGSLVSGIVSLFGGSAKAPVTLTQFQLPDPISKVATLSGGRGGSVNTNANMGSSATKQTESTPFGVSTGFTATESQSTAFDTQWFLDRSNQIASAVKTAMLNSHSLNDVVAET